MEWNLLLVFREIKDSRTMSFLIERVARGREKGATFGYCERMLTHYPLSATWVEIAFNR
jgi:hypothetical protein